MQDKFELGLGQIIFDRVMPLLLRIKEVIFSFHSLVWRDAYVKLKLHNIQIFYQKVQVRAKFGPGLMIFDRVIPFELTEKKRNLSLIYANKCKPKNGIWNFGCHFRTHLP